MEKIEAHAIRFSVSLNIDAGELVYMSQKAYDEIPESTQWRFSDKDFFKVSDEYFTKEKIEELKKKFCEHIMKSENPFDIFETGTDLVLVDEEKIWK